MYSRSYIPKIFTLPDCLLHIIPNTPHRINPTEKKFNSTVKNNTLTTIGMSNLSKRIGFKKQKTMKHRNVVETTSPNIQCREVLHISKEDAVGMDCYICGIKMEKTSGLNPECDHYLRISQAKYLLSLYQSDRVSDTTINGFNTKNKNILSKEYGWAHQICNRIKSNWMFIKLHRNRNGQYIFVVDENNLKNNLRNIWNNRYLYKAAWDNQDLFTKKLWTAYKNGNFNQSRDKFIQERYNKLSQGPYKRICDFLNGYAPELLTLAGISSVIYGTKHQKVSLPLLYELQPSIGKPITPYKSPTTSRKRKVLSNQENTNAAAARILLGFKN